VCYFLRGVDSGLSGRVKYVLGKCIALRTSWFSSWLGYSEVNREDSI
jgi:hypothetical protein